MELMPIGGKRRRMQAFENIAPSGAGGAFRRRKSRVRPMFRKFNVPRLISNAKRRNFVKNVKSLTMGNSETKYSSGSLVTGVLSHNTLTQFHLWGDGGASDFNIMPGQGTTDGSRIGDRITIQGFMVRGQIDVFWDHRDITVVLYFVPHNSNQGNPGDRTQLFHDVSSSIMLDPLQKKRFPQAKKIGTVTLKSTDLSTGTYGGSVGEPTTHGTKTMHFKRWIPYNRKCYFLADASAKPSNLPEYGTLVVGAYSRYNNIHTDNIVSGGQINATVYFKDI